MRRPHPPFSLPLTLQHAPLFSRPRHHMHNSQNGGRGWGGGAGRPGMGRIWIHLVSWVDRATLLTLLAMCRRVSPGTPHSQILARPRRARFASLRQMSQGHKRRRACANNSPFPPPSPPSHTTTTTPPYAGASPTMTPSHWGAFRVGSPWVAHTCAPHVVHCGPLSRALSHAWQKHAGAWLQELVRVRVHVRASDSAYARVGSLALGRHQGALPRGPGPGSLRASWLEHVPHG